MPFTKEGEQGILSIPLYNNAGTSIFTRPINP